MKEPVLETPDGHYIVVRGHLWRKSNPHLPEDEQKRLVSELMAARRAVKEATGDPENLGEARKAPTVSRMKRRSLDLPKTPQHHLRAKNDERDQEPALERRWADRLSYSLTKPHADQRRGNGES